MTEADLTAEAIEKLKISQLMATWGIWRDGGDWDGLRTTYTADATMVTSWFDGTAATFIDVSAQMLAETSDRISTQHLIGGSAIEIFGTRATAETRMSVLIRLLVHGIESDVTAVGRFHDLLLRTGPYWQIRRRVAVFEKDSVQAVDPAATLRLEKSQLVRYPPAYRCCCYVMAANGIKINPNLPVPNSPSMNALYAQARTWLTGA